MHRPGKPRTWLATLLAFVIPGAGHMILGLPMKGLILLAGLLLDLIAMIYFAGSGGGEYALLLIYLGLAIPVFWFYSVFDTLQQAARMKEEQGEAEERDTASERTAHALGGLSVVVLGLAMLVLLQSPLWLSPAIGEIGTYAPGAFLMIAAWLLVANRGRNSMFRMGRVTAAVVMLTVGGLLLWDQLQERNDIALLGQWWPAIFILLGLEVVVLSLIYRKSKKRLSFDVGGSFLAVLVAITAFSVTQYSTMPFRWLDQWKVNLGGISGYSDEKGFQYTNEPLSVAVPEDLESLSIHNPNGTVIVRTGDVPDMRIESVTWIDSEDQQEADDTAAESKIEINGTGEITIETKAKVYGTNGSRVPRMNLTVTIPQDSVLAKALEADSNQSTETLPGADSLEGVGTAEEALTGDESALGTPSQVAEEEPEYAASMSIQVDNGTIDVSGLTLPGGLHIQGTNGEIAIAGITGRVEAETKNGGITARSVAGDLKASTGNGNIAASQITGAAEASTISGTITMDQVTGQAELETKNGEIIVHEASSDVQADTLNGDIEIHSAVVGGDWNINSSIGDIRLFVPEAANFTVNGSVTFGTITSELPLTIGKKTIRGDIGTGGARIDIDANSNIAIRRYTQQ
ncbi:DUF4097 and DUF4098 domain-containing protein YvlB [Paenibacillus phyllosphaerae]|uniref:DUF4097 and DUF4098 domain-containing protein YvlB n=1 Tax=Paenibacillus phyllosphaerae TaxID=274593 RepID=A0A7W5B129_9BACL|nr:DUF4097 family beta strand repeat-containing protein [Paenibacillus phyllosphaerae]MBB3112179.1 DUF4097 and DUF4098 domain-containing protein YvlB [Paenibacillus phyllosphaerae]